MVKMPSIFVSHESPQMWDSDSPARVFLQGLGRVLPKPKALLVVSAHWQAPEFAVSSSDTPSTIHDFGGFPQQYYQIQYPAPGSASIARDVIDAASCQGIAIDEDTNRGMDHAVWLAAGLIYPNADIPVVSLSIKRRGTPQEHFALGQSLAALREQGILIVGSGTATHNLGAFFGATPPAIDAPPGKEAKAFSLWLKENIDQPEAIIDYNKAAPHASFCHPTPDHFYPLIVAMGAGQDDQATCMHESFNYAHFAMTSFRWG